MAKPTETRIAILIQVMDELGFDREIIAKISKVPQRTVSYIANRGGAFGPFLRASLSRKSSEAKPRLLRMWF